MAVPPAASSIPSKQDVLLDSLKKFYADPAHLRVLTDVLAAHKSDDPAGGGAGAGAGGGGAAGGGHISLRILDWLVTNYAKKHNIVYLVPDADGASKTFNMFLEYKSQLKAYSKRFFDPFCRRERLDFTDADGRTFNTTVGQLNFFRWALQHGVVDYGTRNNRHIEDDMLQSIRHRLGAGGGVAAKPKRRELSKAAIKGCTKTHVKVTVRFS
jgi:hypothetical protein